MHLIPKTEKAYKVLFAVIFFITLSVNELLAMDKNKLPIENKLVHNFSADKLKYIFEDHYKRIKIRGKENFLHIELLDHKDLTKSYTKAIGGNKSKLKNLIALDYDHASEVIYVLCQRKNYQEVLAFNFNASGNQKPLRTISLAPNKEFIDLKIFYSQKGLSLLAADGIYYHSFDPVENNKGSSPAILQFKLSFKAKPVDFVKKDKTIFVIDEKKNLYQIPLAKDKTAKRISLKKKLKRAPASIEIIDDNLILYDKKQRGLKSFKISEK